MAEEAKKNTERQNNNDTRAYHRYLKKWYLNRQKKEPQTAEPEVDQSSSDPNVARVRRDFTTDIELPEQGEGLATVAKAAQALQAANAAAGAEPDQNQIDEPLDETPEITPPLPPTDAATPETPATPPFVPTDKGEKEGQPNAEGGAKKSKKPAGQNQPLSKEDWIKAGRPSGQTPLEQDEEATPETAEQSTNPRQPTDTETAPNAPAIDKIPRSRPTTGVGPAAPPENFSAAPAADTTAKIETPTAEQPDESAGETTVAPPITEEEPSRHSEVPTTAPEKARQPEPYKIQPDEAETANPEAFFSSADKEEPAAEPEKEITDEVPAADATPPSISSPEDEAGAAAEMMMGQQARRRSADGARTDNPIPDAANEALPEGSRAMDEDQPGGGMVTQTKRAGAGQINKLARPIKSALNWSRIKKLNNEIKQKQRELKKIGQELKPEDKALARLKTSRRLALWSDFLTAAGISIAKGMAAASTVIGIVIALIWYWSFKLLYIFLKHLIMGKGGRAVEKLDELIKKQEEKIAASKQRQNPIIQNIQTSAREINQLRNIIPEEEEPAEEKLAA